jgi:Cation/multidrug efflux pump
MYGFAGRLAHYFIDSKLTPVLILVSLALGLFAIVTTPKEEEPQIVVPMIDIMLSYPGASPEEVERRVVAPLEKKLWELKDIEYIYSYAGEGMAVVTARFYVGTDPVKALVDLNTKMMSAMDLAPPGVILPPLIKPMSIDDVPILTLTLWGKNYDWYELRRLAASIENEIKKIQNVADVFLVGGRPREVRVILDPQRLEHYRISPLYVAQVLRSANVQMQSGTLLSQNYEYKVRTGTFFESKKDVENLLVGVFGGRPVYLKDVADVVDGPSEVKDYVLIGFGPSAKDQDVKTGELYPAVTIAVAKRKGTNAIDVANEVIGLVEHLKGKHLPKDLNITITRNYGKTAKEKSDDLLKKLFIATASVILLIAVTLGIKEAIVVGIAVPVTLSIALFISEALGFTLNRVTLFALIFAIGILVSIVLSTTTASGGNSPISRSRGGVKDFMYSSSSLLRSIFTLFTTSSTASRMARSISSTSSLVAHFLGLRLNTAQYSGSFVESSYVPILCASFTISSLSMPISGLSRGISSPLSMAANACSVCEETCPSDSPVARATAFTTRATSAAAR